MNNVTQNIQVTPRHSSLESTLSKFLAKQDEASTMEADEAIICDFGAQYKLLSTKAPAGLNTELRVSVPSWESVAKVATTRLQSIFGKSAFVSNGDNHQGYDFSININEAMKSFDSAEECILALSQVRILALGAPISLALQRIVDASKRTEAATSTTVQRLRLFPKCGQCYCLGSTDK